MYHVQKRNIADTAFSRVHLSIKIIKFSLGANQTGFYETEP